MKKIFLYILVALIGNSAQAQKIFTDIIKVDKTSVKNQQRSGTCWSFATASFIESEVLRIKKEVYDLSEMYSVRNIYEDKARNYFLRHGKANFSEGGLAHDYIRAIANYGIVPESVYNGKPKNEKVYNHTELFKVLDGYLKGSVGSKLHTDYWMEGFSAILDVYFGKKPLKFNYKNKEYTPMSFAKELGIKPANYIELTSFNHHPYYKYFVLEIPDNYSSGFYYNIKLNELKAQTDFALENGFSVSWDGDVSENGFGRNNGIIVLDNDDDSMFSKDGDFSEIVNLRQDQFEKIKTTDDHLMHIVGKAKDETGKIYYIIKNSWGDAGAFDGYYYMSEPFFLMKTIAIMIHKDALMKRVKPKIYLPDAIF